MSQFSNDLNKLETEAKALATDSTFTKVWHFAVLHKGIILFVVGLVVGLIL